MLVSIESYFHDALRPAIPHDVDVVTGPSLGPSNDDAQLLEVSALGLKLALPEGDDLTAPREASFQGGTHRWPANGRQVDFVLPKGVQGEVVEVESPPGRPLRRGDDYMLEGRTVRFFRPPAQADVAVVAFLRGERAHGFLERRSCEITLVTRAWAREHGAADKLLSGALAAALVASVDLGNLDDSASDESGVRIRLLRPVMTLLGLSRGTEVFHETSFFRAQAEFLIRGQLEQLIAVGEPEPTGIIREVRKV
jgi:hypothetical protein